MLPSGAVLPLIFFLALLLAAALCGLAASGHFPEEHRSPTMRSSSGVFVLLVSLTISILSLAIGLVLVWRSVPWYATVIGGGGVLLAAPLALRPFPDRFVNGRGALIVFAGVSMLMLVLLFHSVGGQAGQ
jgi:hypothetical protein